jgi:hypothetical protein
VHKPRTWFELPNRFPHWLRKFPHNSRTTSWLDIFRPRCSVAASNFGQVMRSRIFPTYSTPTPTTRGTTAKAFKLSTSDRLHIPMVVDTGASLSLTPFLDDFDNTPGKLELKELQAVSSATKVEGIGTVCWKVIDLYSAVHTLKTKAYYVLTAHIRLYSPQAHFRESSKGSLDLNLETLTLRFPNKVKLVFPINPANQLLLMFLDDHQGPQVGFSSKDSELFDDSRYVLTSVADEVNQNLDGPQRELLLWHHKLGHINFDWLQVLLKHERRNPNARKILEVKFSSVYTPAVLLKG